MSIVDVVTIAVLGVTGAGKSTFVQRVTQDPSIVIGHSLRAETRTTASYKFEHNGIRYEIVDCPGFNDTVRPDSEILEDIVAWLHKAHGEGKLLSAVIYLHRISDTRVQGTTMTQFRVLQELCGDEFYRNLILGTTFWSRVSEEVGRDREANLLEVKNFFGEMKDEGARYMRIPDDREGCLAILENVSSNQRRQLKAQKERAEGKSFKDTAA
ncbi:P-loop containing nucleoside triphosphate hydrolase protein, partial [Lasiosphaeria miniovina]